MKEGMPSQTAMFVAFTRAVGAREPELSRACRDDVAERWLPRPWRNVLAAAQAVPRPALAFRALRYASLGQVDHLAFRTAVIDQAVVDAVAGGARQVVLLGAGLDSRAHRLEALQGCTVFEVDHPSTQRFKMRKAASLATRGGQVRYAACDFEQVTLDRALLDQGFAVEVPAVWIWEGVTMYLERPAVDAALALIDALSAPGSTLIATYVTPKLTVRKHPFVGVGLALLALASEPVRSAYTTEQMGDLLRLHGFGVTYDTLPADAAPRFSVQRTLRYWAMPDEHVLVAQKPSAASSHGG